MRYLKADALIRAASSDNTVDASSLELLQPAVVGIDSGGALQYVGDAPPEDVDDTDVTDLGDVVLAPGQVNAHSHAFQRAIRGRTEYVPADQQADDFWSWREAMYRAVLAMDADAFESVARQAFSEMLRAGYTTVGEFHYVHHRPDGTTYPNPNELAERIARAARDVGIRISILRTAYHRGGPDEPPTDRQRRFVEPDLETYLRRFEKLRESIRDRTETNRKNSSPLASVGLAPHSIRACPPDWLERLGEYARSHELPLHIHVSEQTDELDQSRTEYGTTPIEALHELNVLGNHVTLIHATHATDRELELLEAKRPTVCACPSTERNLGDGFLPAKELAERRVPICIGSDSQADVDPWGELRLIEYHERLRRRRRNVLATDRLSRRSTDDEAVGRSADVLFPMGTRHGARALGLPVGRLRRGAPADFVGIDLNHDSMIGAAGRDIPATLVMSARPDAVTDVWVQGERVIRNGSHPDGDGIRESFRSTMSSLRAEE